jgi:hypothetical protein
MENKRLEQLAKLEGDWLHWLKLATSTLSKQLIQVKSNRLTGSSRKPKTSTKASYEGLEGQWLDWLNIARRFEIKVPSQDREDLRHNIILELALARLKATEPIPEHKAYRIASYTVADYWRHRQKITTGLDCHYCSKAQRKKCHDEDLYSECPKLIRLEYLEAEQIDSEGNRVTVQDTLADDKAIDLDQWLDVNTFLSGCPIRLIELAHKRLEGIPLSDTDQRYYSRQRAKEYKRYQTSLF